MKTFNGKAIYNPSGKAGEYSKWACNFYNGCSNGCTYCYLKKGVLAHVMGDDKPVLKGCFNNEIHALQVFEKELSKNIDSLREHGLFFTFTSDPMLDKCISLTKSAVQICLAYNIPVKILTKRADWLDNFTLHSTKENMLNLIAFGFTLTGHDELEPGASTNAERIEAMKQLHEAGFKTFASIEPIIDFESSFEMIRATVRFCDLYKIGLESGKRYSKPDCIKFIFKTLHIANCNSNVVYFKDSILKSVGFDRSDLMKDEKCCVTRDYNLFR